MAEPLLELRSVAVEYTIGMRSTLRAVDGVDLSVAARETVGLVGESGSGKSTIARAILGLTFVREGAIRFAGLDITRASERERRRLSARLQAIFQDPYSSLSPTRTIGQTLAEPLQVHLELGRAQLRQRVGEMLERVGLPAATQESYPVRLSGGQRQRVAIARALMLRPQLVICDEPVSSLDLSVQAQVLNLLQELQVDLEVSYLFISHDLAVVRHLSHRIVVLYRGRVMEQGAADVVCDRPAHPYTRALLDAAPIPDPEVQRQRRRTRESGVASAVVPAPGGGCPFASRCAHAIDICRSRHPHAEVTGEGTQVACHRWREFAAAGGPTS